MAKSFDINSSSYAGELALPYIAPAILSANTVANNLITIHNNVKFKAVLKKLSNAAEIVDTASCDFTATAADLDLDEIVLAVTELQVNQELCKKDFRSDWEALQTGASLLGDRVPPNFETFLLQFLAGKVQENIEKSIWGGNFSPTDSVVNGTGAVTTSFDGLLHHIVDGASSLGNDDQVAGAISAANVLARLDAVVSDAPSAVLNNGNSRIYMSRKSAFLLQRALGGVVDRVENVTSEGSASAATAPAQGGLLMAGMPGQYMGFPIVVPMGCPDDVILFADPANLHFGNNLYTDQIEARVVDMALTDASDNVRVAMRFNGGTQVGHLGDISVMRRTS